MLDIILYYAVRNPLFMFAEKERMAPYMNLERRTRETVATPSDYKRSIYIE